jgi:hypothetical protein
MKNRYVRIAAMRVRAYDGLGASDVDRASAEACIVCRSPAAPRRASLSVANVGLAIVTEQADL